MKRIKATHFIEVWRGLRCVYQEPIENIERLQFLALHDKIIAIFKIRYK